MRQSFGVRVIHAATGALRGHIGARSLGFLRGLSIVSMALSTGKPAKRAIDLHRPDRQMKIKSAPEFEPSSCRCPIRRPTCSGALFRAPAGSGTVAASARRMSLGHRSKSAFMLMPAGQPDQRLLTTGAAMPAFRFPKAAVRAIYPMTLIRCTDVGLESRLLDAFPASRLKMDSSFAA
jgi:hypothetical protein